MYYISRLRLVNVRCFPGSSTIKLLPPGRHGDMASWTLILGDNGTGKTTLLRSIAMGLCDETGASGLLSEVSGELIRTDCKEAEIEIELTDTTGANNALTITTRLTANGAAAEDLKQTVQPSDFDRPRIFACGYGAAVRSLGNESYEKYRTIDAVYSLFNYDSRLQNPETALYRISREGVPIEDLLLRIDRILDLESGSTTLDSSGMQVNGPWGKFVPVGSLGDGYVATIAWICDMLGWSLLLHRTHFSQRVEGIVLIDELEKHLHPSWQRQIIGRLADEFPGIQFIATTHAPLTAIGSASLPDELCQLILLQQSVDGVDIRDGLLPPSDSRADQVLTSYLFGLASTTSDRVADAVARYSKLLTEPNRTQIQDEEVARLRNDLDQVFAGSESQLHSQVREAVMTVLNNQARDALESGGLDLSALDYESRRQLKNLFGGS